MACYSGQFPVEHLFKFFRRGGALHSLVDFVRKGTHNLQQLELTPESCV